MCPMGGRFFMTNIKKPTTIKQQLELLQSRGCIINDKDFCIEQLKLVNYYRLSAYFLPFKTSQNTYKENSTFEKIIKIYEFDKELRNLLFSAIEDIEIYLKSQFAYFHSHKYGSLGYLDKNNFSNKHNKQKFNELLKKEIEKNKNISFVKHHIQNYDGKFPLWVITELFTFGNISYFYADLKTCDQKELSRSLYNNTPTNIISYLRCCTDLRNICAHYGRLYYRIFSAIPANANIEKNAERKLFGALFALKSLYPTTEKWNTIFIPKLEKLIKDYSSYINLEHIGFSINWKDVLIKCQHCVAKTNLF